MKRFLGALALACVICVSAFAGELPTSGITTTLPGELPTSGVTSPSPSGTTSPGELPTSGFAEQVSDVALCALLSALTW